MSDQQENESLDKNKDIISHKASTGIPDNSANDFTNNPPIETMETMENIPPKNTPAMNSPDNTEENTKIDLPPESIFDQGPVTDNPSECISEQDTVIDCARESIFEQVPVMNTTALVSENNENALTQTEVKAIITQAAAEISKKQKNKLTIAAIVMACTMLIGIGFCSIFSLINLGNEKIFSNVKINNIDVEGLTKDEAAQALTNQYTLWQSQTINLKTDDYTENINALDIEFSHEIQSSVEAAYQLGRSGNFFENNFRILLLLLKGENIIGDFTYNQEKLDLIIDTIANTIPRKYIDNSHYIDGEKLFIVKGKSGDIVKKEEMKDLVIQALFNKNSEIEVPLEHKKVPDLDLETIYKDIYTEPKDAYYTKDNGKYTLYPHVLGVSFDMQSAQKIFEQEKDEYSIPLKFTYPKTTTNQIGIEAFPDQLASYSTKYDPGQTSRSENLKVASGKINEKVLMPGEVFSYNEILGKRTIENGYKEAGVYEGNKVVQGVGGGICQVSSSLYNAVLLANLEIVERTNHGLPVGYVPPSQDATVSYGTIDFKFKNSRTYPIKIIAYSTNGNCVVIIHGMKEDVEYEVVIESIVQERTPFSTINETVTSLKPNTKIVVQKGAGGCKSVAYRVLKHNGNIISRTLLSTDKYAPINEIVQVGQ